MHFLLRAVAALSLAASLAACGFHLRGEGSGDLAQKRISVDMVQPEADEMVFQLKQQFRLGGADVVEQNAEFSVKLRSAQWGRKILAVERGGKRQQFQLSYSVRYELIDKAGDSLLPAQEVTLVRDFLFDPSYVLAMGSQETALKDELIGDMARIIVTQLRRSSQRVVHAN